MCNIKINLEHCYGIRKMSHSFDFSVSKIFVVYAPNGVMKTSLAKTFQDLSSQKKSEDRVFRDRTAIREVVDQNGVEINPDEIFVVEPYNQDYKSSKISTLLVNKELKIDYERIHSNVNEKKDLLLETLQAKASTKQDTEALISLAFMHTKNDFFTAIGGVKSEVVQDRYGQFKDVVYTDIFNEKVLSFLKTPGIVSAINEYITVYDRLLTSSTFFKKGVFNHNNATEIAKNLKDNGFFKARHSVSISIGGKLQNINSEKELEAVIESEKNNILNNVELKKSFDAIDKKLTKNKELKAFREYIEDKQFIIPELANIDALERKIWIAYLSETKSLYLELLGIYDKAKEEISLILEKAKEEHTQWQNVVEIFNRRFSVPFIVKVENQGDVITKEDAPNICFDFKENDDVVPIEEADLKTLLSNGEKRALYILNIIFEVEARKALKQKTFFIIDDIADSFDYKNKYAIMEYLQDIATEDNFFQIILTHNFDFHRTISSRLALPRAARFHTVKSSSRIELIEEKYQKNPFETWVKCLERDPAMLIASISFLRNIAEYSENIELANNLTALLHKKPMTDEITIAKLENMINSILPKKSLEQYGYDTKLKKLVYTTADNILNETEQVMDLEKKIVLSIAIRLKTEEFLISKINDAAWVQSISSNQTSKLIRRYTELFPTEYGKISILNRVNLMTPENIHINSFMYEPILDMDNHHLKQLLEDVRTLNL